MLGDQLAWCIEPSVNIGASGGTYGLNGDAAHWLMDKYGWSYKKTNNLTKAVYLAKSYYGNDWLCSYVLVQNLIWSEIKENESRHTDTRVNQNAGRAIEPARSK